MNMSNLEKVTRDGKVAVLYSPGYGAGWFTWNRDYPECLFSPTLIKLVEEGRLFGDQLEAEALRLFGEDFYAGGARDLKIKWLREGTQFQVNEYDGSESIQVNEQTNWYVA